MDPFAVRIGGWDTSENAAIKIDAPPAPLTLVDAAIASGSGGTLDYFLRFTLFDGQVVTLNGGELFGITSFSLGSENDPLASASGKMTFDPLVLTFDQNGLQPDLFRMLASGDAFHTVELLGYSRGPDGGHLVSDYSFGGGPDGFVAVARLGTDTSGATQLSLDVSSEIDKQYIQQPDGTFASTHTGWDRVKNEDIKADAPPAPLTLVDAAIASGTGATLDYFVRFTLFNGQVVTLNGGELFGIKTFSLGGENDPFDPLPHRLTFDPLVLTFDQNGLQPDLFKMLGAGTLFHTVELLGYSGGPDGGHLISDYSFGGGSDGFVAAARLTTNTSGTTQLSLDFSSEINKQYIQEPDGSFTSTHTGWDRVKNVSLFGDAPAAPLTEADASVAVGSGGPLDYFVRFTLFNGQVVTLNGGELFGIRSFSLGSENDPLAGTGRLTFDPLVLDFAQNALQPELLVMLASGDAFHTVELLGYSQSRGPDGGHLISDYSLGGGGDGFVAPARLTISSSGATQLVLDFSSEIDKQYIQQPDGSFTSTHTGWDSVKNIAIFTDAPGGPVTVADASVASGSGGALDYFVRFTLFNGQVVTLNGGELFRINDFSLSHENDPLDLSLQRVTFDPLELNFDQNGLQPQLFQMLGAGTAFHDVELLGYDPNGGHIISDYSFGGGTDGFVAVTRLVTSTSGTTQLSLDFSSEINKQYTGQPDGSFTSTHTGWDHLKNVSISSDAPAAPVTEADASIAPASGGPLDYFVRFTLSSGEQLTLGGGNLFGIERFLLGSENDPLIGSGSGKATSDPLVLLFDQSGLQPQLLEMLGSGQGFHDVELLGYSQGGGPNGGHLISDYSFGGGTDGFAAVARLATDTSGTTQLTLDFSAEIDKQYTEQRDGSFTSAHTGWDFLKNKAIDDDAPAAPVTLADAAVAPASGSPLDYFVRFTLSDGQVLALDGELFGIRSFSLGSEINPAKVGDPNDPEGKARFDPLVLRFDQNALQPDLFKLLASGIAFQDVELLGYSHIGGPNRGHLISDYSFSGGVGGAIVATGLTTDESGTTQLSIDFAAEIDKQYVAPPTHAPILQHAIADQSVLAGAFWQFTVAADAFFDDGDRLTYAATLADGSPLPSWLTFDEASRTFSGTPPQHLTDVGHLRVIASDAGLSTEDTFTLTVVPQNHAPGISGSVVLAALDEKIGQRLITQSDLLANASDPDGDPLIAINLAIAKGSGTLVDNHDGTWTYSPAHDASTSVSFSYQVSDSLAAPVADSASLGIPRAQSAPPLPGTPGDDTFTAAPGSAAYDGLAGVDTIVFDFKLTDATVSFLGNQVIVDGPASHTVLTGFEIFKFSDGTVNNNDSDPLVDDLFYYSHNHEVWTAHLDADTDFHNVGWKAGRDPDAFFSTSTYLSKNADVKAAGVDPLLHFDQSGWREGRAASIAFDPQKYLAANPDVAAAHVDPLAQYLAYGEGEGRQPVAPSVLLGPNGFDYVYYLQHNPDVAAAHVDPFQHYETAGWREGRNPNAFFDTAGYLAHDADVAAAGINPLDHYHQSGWTEGRDPSVSFDTRHYLAAYPDVAAAHIDPLVHFLQHGQFEGRSTFADGVWG